MREKVTEKTIGPGGRGGMVCRREAGEGVIVGRGEGASVVWPGVGKIV